MVSTRRPLSIRLPAAGLALAVAVTLQGCGGDEGPVDDGGQAVVDLIGLEEAGIAVVDPASPAAATTAQVEAALTEAGAAELAVGTPADAGDLLGLDQRIAGLLGTVSEAGLVVLVFDDPPSAAVFAASAPPVRLQGSAGGPEGSLAGNLVAYASPDLAEQAATALSALG